MDNTCRPTTHSGTESTRTSTNAIPPEGDDGSDEVQPQEEPPDGPSAPEGRRTSLRGALLQLLRLARPEGCFAAYDYWSMCGPNGTLLWAGLARDFIGPHGPRSAASDPRGTYQGTHWSQLRAGPSRTWTTNLLRHRDYGIGRPSGNFRPAHHWDRSPGKVIRHSTRRATRPFRGAGLSSGSVRWRTRKRTTAGGPSGAMDT